MWLQFQTLLALLDIQVDTGWGKIKKTLCQLDQGRCSRRKERWVQQVKEAVNEEDEEQTPWSFVTTFTKAVSVEGAV